MRATTLLLVLLSSACDPATTVRTTARGAPAVDYSCALQAAESEFRDAEVRGQPEHNRVVVWISSVGAMTFTPTAPGKGEFSVETVWLGTPKTERLARMEGLQREAIQAILVRCGRPPPVSLSCWSSRGPVSGETCFGASPSK